MTDIEMVEMVLNNLGLRYELLLGINTISIELINDGYINREKVCSHEAITFEFDNDGKFNCIVVC